MVGLHINEAKKRGEELEMKVLRFLHTESYSNFKNLMELTRIDKSNLSRLLRRLTKKNMLKKHDLVFDTHNVLLWGILDEGIHKVADIDNAPLYNFQPKKVSISTINHTLMNQRVRLAIEHLGWTDWENSDRKKFISKYSVTHRPDAIVTNPNRVIMAIETELTLKTSLRYRSIAKSHVEAIKENFWHHVVYIVRDEEYKKMLNRRFDGIKYVQFDNSRHDFDKHYRQYFYIFTIDELKELETTHQESFKNLFKLWDRKYYDSKYSKTKTENPQDGISACNLLFNIEQKNGTLEGYQNDDWCYGDSTVQHEASYILKVLRQERENLKNVYEGWEKKWGVKPQIAMFFSNYQDIQLRIDDKSLCITSGLLIKIFRLAQNYCQILYVGLIDGKISKESHTKRQEELVVFLDSILKTITIQSRKLK